MLCWWRRRRRKRSCLWRSTARRWTKTSKKEAKVHRAAVFYRCIHLEIDIKGAAFRLFLCSFQMENSRWKNTHWKVNPFHSDGHAPTLLCVSYKILGFNMRHLTLDLIILEETRQRCVRFSRFPKNKPDKYYPAIYYFIKIGTANAI